MQKVLYWINFCLLYQSSSFVPLTFQSLIQSRRIWIKPTQNKFEYEFHLKIGYSFLPLNIIIERLMQKYQLLISNYNLAVIKLLSSNVCLYYRTSGFATKHVVVFQPNWSNNTLKSGFFPISGKTGSRIRNFFGLKLSRDQDGANKKKFSKIGPAVPEEMGRKHTNTHASK